MNLLVFADSLLLIFIGVGMKGGQGIVFGLIYGVLGGITAALMFDMTAIALIMISSRDKRSQAGAKKAASPGNGARAKI